MNMYAYVGNDPMNMVDPTGEAGVVAWFLRLGSSAAKAGAKMTKNQAVNARRSGENVQAQSRQIAKQIETAAHGTEKQMKHKGHDLPDGSVGRPHYQTDGARGHTFWSLVGATLLGASEALDSAAAIAEIVDPTSYIGSGGQYADDNGNLVPYSQIVENRSSGGEGSGASNSDNGMSGGNVTICSGMGAVKGGC